MGAEKAFIIILSILLLCLTSAIAVDTATPLEKDCLTYCTAKNYNGAFDCFDKTRNKADAYLAVATCAYNNADDSVAEDYAIKAANQKWAWIMWVRKIPGVSSKIRTGGLAETYMLAYMASGGARYESTAKDYLRTSGQCYNAPDKDACVEGYFISYTSQIKGRGLMAARSSNAWVDEAALKGTITDVEGHPLKNLKVTLNCVQSYTTYTDESGKYEFKWNTSYDYCPNARLYAKLEYFKENKIWFRIRWNGDSMWLGKKLNIRGKEDLIQDIAFTENLTSADYITNNALNDIHHYGIMYHHMTEALEFYKDFLRVNVEYMLPVDVIPGHPTDGTWYDPTDSSIVIKATDTVRQDTDRPINREFHEFSHHAMYSLYRSWPQYAYPGAPAEKNHGGYANPSTADAYMEGWAEFMSLMIAEHYHYPQPGVYPTDGTVEVNWKAYDIRGLMEEYAVAGVLWDLYDRKDYDDNVQLSFNEIWDVIQNKDDNFADVMDKFIAKNPKIKKDIEEIWKQHGFFADKTPGDGRYNWTYEAYLDYNNNGWRNNNEPWVDYSTQPPWAFPYMSWQEGEVIGPAASYNRTLRNATPERAGFYVKVNNDVPYYTVKVEFKDHSDLSYEIKAENKDGLVYVMVPPSSYAATITVTPLGVSAGKPITFRNDKFEEKYFPAMQDGYYMEHDFEITGTMPEKETVAETQKGSSTPYFEVLDKKADPNGFVYKAPESQDSYPSSGVSLAGKGGFSKIMIYIVIIVVAVIVLAVVVRKKKHKKEKNK